MAETIKFCEIAITARDFSEKMIFVYKIDQFSEVKLDLAVLLARQLRNIIFFIVEFNSLIITSLIYLNGWFDIYNKL